LNIDRSTSNGEWEMNVERIQLRHAPDPHRIEVRPDPVVGIQHCRHAKTARIERI
jgi:hypothetical protein